MPQNYTRVEIKVEDSLLDQIDRAAQVAGVSRAEWIREACRVNIDLSKTPAFMRYVLEQLRRIS